jgi:hypothetical protein
VLNKVGNVTAPIASAAIPHPLLDVDSEAIRPTAHGARSHQLSTLVLEPDATAGKLILDGGCLSKFNCIVADVTSWGYI